MIGFNLIRAVHDSKRGGVFIYYKEDIDLIKRVDICPLDNCLETEIGSQTEKLHLSFPESEQWWVWWFLYKIWFTSEHDVNHGLPLLSVVKGDFNACYSRWWQNDITNSAGQGINSLTSSTEHREIIDKPTHVASNSMLSVDILFCTNQNAILNYGVIFDCLINVTMTWYSVRLTSAHHSLQYISV